MGQAYLDQDSFHWRNDNGSETTATYIGSANDDLTSPSLDSPYRLRFLLQNTGDKDRTDGYRLEYNVSGAGWVAVTTSSSYVRSVSSANTSWTLTDEDATTQQLGTGTFDEGYWDDTGTTTSFTFAQAQESELEFCFQFRSADVPGGAVVQLRVADDAGAALNLYTNTPSTTFPGGEIQQSHFRVRYDLDALNSEGSGWIANLDTDCEADSDKRIRIRFELEELASISKTTGTLKLQSNKNGGGWVDVPYYTWRSEAANPAVFITESDNYADAAATTNLLSGSAKSFVAGTGEENATFAAVSLNNQHTEIEVCLVIRKFYDGPSHNADGDYWDFRIVESDNTLLDGTYENPRVTLNHAVGHIGGTMVETPGRIGAFCDTNGNLYMMMEASEIDPEMLMVKSPDGGDSWAEVDGANRPLSGDIEAADIQKVGDTLWILAQAGSGGVGGDPVALHKFRMSDHATNPDTWELTDELVEDVSVSNQTAGIAVLSDGRVRAVYGKNDGVENLYYNTRSSGGSWGGSTVLDSTGSTVFDFVFVVLGESDLVHIFYKDDTNNTIYHKSLASNETLSGREAVESNSIADLRSGMTEGVYWDDSGDEKVMILVQDNTDKKLYSVLVTNDGSPATRKAASDNAVPVESEFGTSRQPIASLAVDAATGICYLRYAHATNWDIYEDEAENDGGWGTDTVEVSLSECEWVRSLVFTHSAGNGGAKVLGYIYDTGSMGGTGFLEYAEYEIPVEAVFPPVPGRVHRDHRSPLIRM